jgi:hypothetical protein
MYIYSIYTHTYTHTYISKLEKYVHHQCIFPSRKYFGFEKLTSAVEAEKYCLSVYLSLSLSFSLSLARSLRVCSPLTSCLMISAVPVHHPNSPLLSFPLLSHQESLGGQSSWQNPEQKIFIWNLILGSMTATIGTLPYKLNGRCSPS